MGLECHNEGLENCIDFKAGGGNHRKKGVLITLGI